jgi:hypothetical protein
MKKNAVDQANCYWIHKNERHICSPPKTCLEKAMKKAGCYVYKKSKSLAKRCSWIKSHP